MVFNTNSTCKQVFDLRRRLFHNGYRPIAIPNRLKYPVDKAWPDLARQNPPFDCTHPTESNRRNTGIIADGLRVIDVDIDDADKVVELVRHCDAQFGEAPARYRMNSARIALLYAAADGEPPKASVKNRITGEAVEVLGKGNQLFAFGLHPSGEPLLWADGPDVTPRGDLIALTDEQIIQFLDFCTGLVNADRISHRAIDMPLPVPHRSGDEWLIGDIKSALDEIPNGFKDWPVWFGITAAVVLASGGDPDAYLAWLAWSRQCPAHDDRYAAKTWHNLCGDPPDEITVGTLYHHARMTTPDWDKPSENGIPATTHFQLQIIEDTMSFLNRQHVAETSNTAKIVKWDETAAAFTYSKRVDSGFQQVPVTEPFAIDIWQTRHGWETWVETNGVKSRQTVLASVNDPLPPKPDGKPVAIYSVPIGSRELGGRRDLVVRGKEPTAAFCDLYDIIYEAMVEQGAANEVPIVEVATRQTADFGNAPVFEINDWENRPALWGPVITNFTVR